MFCKYCGKEIDNDSKFCPYCGEEVDNEQNEVVEIERPNEDGDVTPSKGPWNAFAKVGYILGLLGFILSFFTIGLEAAVPGLVFSILGKRASEDELKEKAKKGLGFAIAGIIIGCIASVVVGIILGIQGYDSFSELIEALLEKYIG